MGLSIFHSFISNSYSLFDKISNKMIGLFFAVIFKIILY